MITTDEKKEFKEKYGKITVIPIDTDKIAKELDAFIRAEVKKAKGSVFAFKIEKGETFVLRGGLAVIKETGILIDRECVGEVIEAGKNATLDVYSETRDAENKVTSFGIMPRFTQKVTIEELVKDYALPETDLPTFMDSRFAYNPRIVSNMRIIADEVKKFKKVKV